MFTMIQYSKQKKNQNYIQHTIPYDQNTEGAERIGDKMPSDEKTFKNFQIILK